MWLVYLVAAVFTNGLHCLSDKSGGGSLTQLSTRDRRWASKKASKRDDSCVCFCVWFWASKSDNIFRGLTTV